MNIQIPQYIQNFFDNQELKTPYLLIDLDTIKKNYTRLISAMPDARHYYAIKANPHPNVLETLFKSGGFFEVASIGEVDMCLSIGISADRLLYGNPLKKEQEILEAYNKGIREFVFDEYSDLQKISRVAAGSKVICRIIADGKGAVSPLTIKFGASFENAKQWLKKAPKLGLIPFGVSFHTGSQQLKAEAWEKPIREASKIFSALEKEGFPLTVLDVGGGFPVSYRQDVPEIETFTKKILEYQADYFTNPPLIYTEAGRYISGNAGFILSEIVQISSDYKDSDLRWIYLDIGRYGGLVEEKIDYPIISKHDGKTGPVVFSGQTCDSNDVIYREKFNYQLPLKAQEGDQVILAYTGAYTTTYSTTLNGFPLLNTLTTKKPIKEKEEINDKSHSTKNRCIYPKDFLDECKFTEDEYQKFPKTSAIKLTNLGEYGKGLISMKSFKRGELIGSFTGVIGSEIKLHTLQISPSLHIHDPNFIGYLIHNCNPNTVLDMQGKRLYCIKDIKKSEQLTMDYATTEDVLSRQFACLCDAPNCRMWVTGRSEKVSEDGASYLKNINNTHFKICS